MVEEGMGGTQEGMTSGFFSGAATGGSLGSLALMGGINPATIGLAIGAATIGGLDGMMRKMKPSAEELSVAYKNQLAETTANVNAANQYVKAQESLNQALDSGDVKKQEAAMKELSGMLNEIVDADLRSQLINASGDMEELTKVIGKLGEESRRQAKEVTFFEEFRKAADAESGWMERWFAWAGK